MADFSITITNQFELFAGEPTNLWNSLVWGTDDWGYNEDVVMEIGKVLVPTPTFTTANVFDVIHILDDTQDLTLTDAICNDVIVDTISFGSTSLSSGLDDLFLQDSEGFYHVFKGNTTDGTDRVVSTFTEITYDSSSWSEVSNPSTSWS